MDLSDLKLIATMLHTVYCVLCVKKVPDIIPCWKIEAWCVSLMKSNLDVAN